MSNSHTKPRVLIVSDSAHIDTGFARVAREIGAGFMESGDYDLYQFGFFHTNTHRPVPFCVIPAEGNYGSHNFDAVIKRVRPDLVLFIGDDWMFQHLLPSCGKCKTVWYAPIDGGPLDLKWARTMSRVDRVVSYGRFGRGVILAHDPQIKVSVINHGVDLETFCPADNNEIKDIRRRLVGRHDCFLVGTVARNQPRKNLPALIKAFSLFIKPWTSCRSCGNVSHSEEEICPQCHGIDLAHGEAKDDAMLYLHTCAIDRAGHDLLSLVSRFGLGEQVRMPHWAEVTASQGVTDHELNLIYNAMDVFALPTMGEGWGLPILEAMACGTPVLVTEYSGHLEFVSGAGETVMCSEFITNATSNMEMAIVSVPDMAMKLDRFYYERDEFESKWGRHLRDGGIPEDVIQSADYGGDLLASMSEAAKSRAADYAWGPIQQKWCDLINELLDFEHDDTPGKLVGLEVI